MARLVRTASSSISAGSAEPSPSADSGASGDDSLWVNGTEDNDVIVKIDGQITWGDPVAETVLYSGVESTTVNGAGGNDTITDPGGNTTILGGPGDDRIIITATSEGGVTLDGEGGSDTFVIVCGSLEGDVQVTDSGTEAQEANRLEIQPADGDNQFLVTSDQVAWGTGTTEVIEYSAAITSLSVETGTGTNSVQIESTSDAGVTITAQGGTDTYEIQLGSLAGPVSVANREHGQRFGNHRRDRRCRMT